MEGARRYFIGGNWKCNGTVESSKDLILNTLNVTEFDTSKVDLVVAPISLHIPLAKAMLKDNIHVAAQNVSRFPEKPGNAYTGEVSAS